MAYQGNIQKANGWTPYLIERPPQGVLCRFRVEGLLEGRSEWTEYSDNFASGVSPLGIEYLWWKLTGIARIEMEGQ